ncbi:MAG: DUF4395 domain-containing protein [Rhizobiales bacterium]|nr:DUF4395 domain-containing protein [Hyphomicrobiales bacterium]
MTQFGEHVPECSIPALNEREARAGAGILFMIAMIAFMHAWLQGNFDLVRLVVIGFFADFFIRVLISPRYAPSLVVGRFFVRNQTPEYAGAAQKRFAWAVGLALATAMAVLFLGLGMRGPVTLLICAVCLALLFFEASFGICLGCMIYNAVMKDPAQLCPGGVCEIREKAPIQRVSLTQAVAFAGFVVAMVIVPPLLPQPAPRLMFAPTSAEADRCVVPDFAKRMGHEEMWKKHNGCS